MPNAQGYKKIQIMLDDGNMKTQGRFFKLKSATKRTKRTKPKRREGYRWTSLCLVYIIPLLWEKNFKKIVLSQSFFLFTPPMEMEKVECSETPAHNVQTLEESPKRKNKTFRSRRKF